MSNIQEQIEESRKNWINWAKKQFEGVDSPTISKEYKQYAKNQYVSEVVKLVKENFETELSKEDDSKGKET